MRATTPIIALTALLLGGTPEQMRAQAALAPPGDASANGPASNRGTLAVRAHPIDSDIRLDGRLDDSAWQNAEVATGFVQQRPTPGEPASERTEARIVYGRDAIYVGMRMYDSAPDSVTTQLARRDATGLTSDWAHVLIDSYFDRRTAFRFSVNPSGVKRDVMHFDDTSEDAGWDAVWQVATSVDSLGWTAEFRIPLSQLRYQAAGAEATWGVNFIRDIARRDERSWWSPVLPNTSGMVSRFGELHGLRDLPSLRRLEIMPYTVGRLTRAPAAQPGDPYYRSNDVWNAIGGDLRYGVTSNLTLTATVNPDFGQVEADPSRVNLSAFETFLPERRPFFQEGADIFQFGIGLGDDNSEQLFYSRRVGRAPQRGVSMPGGYTDVPDAARILGAAKLSGQLPGGWSVGVLNATAGMVNARLMDDRGTETTTPVEPLTNYAVARTTRSFRAGESTVGGIFTATNRRLDDEALQFLNRAAYSGGLDVRHRFGGGNFSVTGSLLGSHIEGSERALLRAQTSSVRYFQRPDAPHVHLDSARTSLQGMAGKAEVWKNAGGNWRWALLSSFRTPGFEINDAGFQTEGDQIMGAGYIGYRQSEPQGPFRRWNVNVNQWQAWTWGGEHISLGGNVNGSFQLHNLWNGYGGINRNQSTLSMWALRGGPAIVRPGRTNAWFGINTDARKAVSVNLDVEAGREDETGGGHRFFAPGLSLRPASHVTLSLSPSMTWNNVAWQCAVPGTNCRAGERYIFAKMEQRTVAMTARLNYTFTPDLSLQFYAQPYVSTGHYSQFREVVDPRQSRFDDRFRPFDAGQLSRNPDTEQYEVRLAGAGQEVPDFSFADPNFSFRQLRSNAVLRWEYRPGSTLFLVWSQGRTGSDTDGGFRFRQDTSELFTAPATNVFMVKLSYWLNA